MTRVPIITYMYVCREHKLKIMHAMLNLNCGNCVPSVLDVLVNNRLFYIFTPLTFVFIILCNPFHVI